MFFNLNLQSGLGFIRNEQLSVSVAQMIAKSRRHVYVSDVAGQPAAWRKKDRGGPGISDKGFQGTRASFPILRIPSTPQAT